MKKFVLSAVIATIFSVTAFADGIKKSSTDNGEENVSYAALSQFKSDFENVNDVTWSVSKTSQKATFTQNNIVYTAYYDAVGEYWGLAQEVTLDHVEKAVQNKLAKNYAGYDVESITRFDSQDENPVVYFINVKNSTQALILTVTAYDGEVKSIEKIK